MAAKILDGNKIAKEILEDAKSQIIQLPGRGIVPKLVVIQIGSDPASTIYVEKKHKTCKEIGIESEIKRYPEKIEYDKFIEEIKKLNSDKSVHGILVQSPLPEHLSHKQVYETISVQKDVDGFHPFNHGKNLLGKEGLQPATPKGIMKLLETTKAKLEGKYAVVIGRSNIVGKPIALMLINAGCTVTVANSKTKNLSDFTKKADILISAVGKPNLIKGDMVKNGATVIDAGNSIEKGRSAGDVDFKSVFKKASYITPVPGGVGPMTVACLLKNLVEIKK